MAQVKDAAHWKHEYEELVKEFDDFKEYSALLEKELEGSLEQSEKLARDLRIRNNSLQLENDNLKDKLDSLKKVTEAAVAELEEDKAQWQKREEDYIKYIRELEQKNDDLERSIRVSNESLKDYETKLNAAIERIVLLESEVDEKEKYQAMTQRLKDQLRDLTQEMYIRDKSKDKDKATVIDSNKISSSQTNGVQSSGGIQPVTPGLTPASRISAMNIVGDLLRKVGALESKLASCRASPDSLISPTDSREPFRTRKLNRGTSSPSIHNLVRS